MHIQTNTTANNWTARPLNRTGDLKGWRERMKAACPDPEVGDVVMLLRGQDSIGYKVLGFKANGEPIWQRGEVVKH